VARRKKEVKTYKYECNLTGEKYTLTKKAENPDDLMSVTAYYQMHPEKDDRPEDIKMKVGFQETAREEAQAEENAEE